MEILSSFQSISYSRAFAEPRAGLGMGAIDL